MEFKDTMKEIFVIILAALVLGITISFRGTSQLLSSFIYFVIILGINLIVKKVIAYMLEADVKAKLWSLYQYGFRKDSHFKNALPMVWIPLFLTLITRGMFWWLAIIEFDITPKVERASKRHGLYRFTEMTDWHVAAIACFGIAANLVLAIIGYLVGFELFARLNIYFALWSLIPISSLDGSKIFFGSRAWWFTMLVIVAIFLGYSLMIV